MNDDDIRRYASLMDELDLSALEIKDEGLSVRMEKNKAAAAVLPKAESAVNAAPAEKKEAEGTFITSPMIGIFYRASAENADPYVETGSRVKKGDTLCIIESMKLMNEIKAECDGRILEICAENGSLVEYGSRLFRIAKDE